MRGGKRSEANALAEEFVDWLSRFGSSLPHYNYFRLATTSRSHFFPPARSFYLQASVLHSLSNRWISCTEQCSLSNDEGEAVYAKEERRLWAGDWNKEASE